ncbi:MAG: toll/interleukin-1 receptor domain-containing protein [Chitinophagaceae bacterium]
MAIQQEDKFWELMIQRIEEEKCTLIIGPHIALKENDKSINEILKEYLESQSDGEIKYYADDEFFSFTDPAEKEYAINDIQKFYNQAKYNELHVKIAEIPFHLIISVSPDRFLENVFKEKKLDYTFEFYNKEQNPAPLEKPTSKKPLIYNLFGDIETEGSLVFTYDDLFDYLIKIFGDFKLPQTLQNELQQSSIVLFIGFKFEKWYFKLLLRLLRLHKVKIKSASDKGAVLLPTVKNFYAEEFKMKFLDSDETEIMNYIYDRCREKNILRIKNQPATVAKPEVFVSYGWGGESEAIVDKICQLLSEKGLHIIRDKIVLGFKGNIKQFMETFGAGKYVIIVLSNKYLTSENCMFEMLELYKNGNVYNRIFPIVLNDAKIYNEIDRIDYINYWDNAIEELKVKHKTIINPVGTGQVIEKINQYNDIRRIIDEITGMLRNMNTLTPEMHLGNDFSILINALDEKIATDTFN